VSNLIRLIRRLAWLPACVCVLLSGSVGAQAPDANFPSRPIKIIVAVSAGGGVDLSARIVADQLQKLWGQPVTVENRTGGSKNIAGEMVAKAEPDGYTLLATPPTRSPPMPCCSSTSTMIRLRSSRWRSWRWARTSWR